MNIGKLDDFMPEHFDKPVYRGALNHLRAEQKVVRAQPKMKFKRTLGGVL